MKKILISSLLLLAFCIPGLSQYNKFVKLLTPTNCSDLAPLSIDNSGKILATIKNFRGQPKLIFAGVNGFTNIDIPLVTSTTRLYPAGFNTAGDFYGAADRLIGNKHILEGFIKCHTTGPIRYFQIPDEAGTVITGINDKGEVVGYYYEPETDPNAPDWIKFEVHGFKSVIQNSGSFPKTEYFDFAGVPETYVTGINNNGDITGYYSWPLAPYETRPVEHGFLLSKGQLYQLDWDFGEGNVWILIPSKINTHGVMVGRAHPLDDTSILSGFILENGAVTIVDYPSVDHDNGLGSDWTHRTVLVDINDAGVIIGEAWGEDTWTQNNWNRGFILTKQ